MFDYCSLFSWLPIVGIVHRDCCFNIYYGIYLNLISLVTGPIVSKSVPVYIDLFKQIFGTNIFTGSKIYTFFWAQHKECGYYKQNWKKHLKFTVM